MNDLEAEFNYMEVIKLYGKDATIIFKQNGYSESEIKKFYELYKEKESTKEKLLEVYKSAYGYQDYDYKENN